MFSGNDANIDWAILAQQWIQRNTQATCNETFNPDNSMPQGSTHTPAFDKRMKMHPGAARNCARFEEKGEADMDMDDDSSPHSTNIDGTNAMIQEPQWLPQSIENLDTISQRQETSATWHAWPNAQSVPVPGVPPQFSKSNPTAHIPSLMKINVSNPNELRTDEEANSNNNSSATIEAAKRKVLPAWIREGLEKMEREKQKQLEREQLKKESGSEHISSPTSTSININQTVNDQTPRALESDESSGNEREEEDVPLNQKNIKFKSVEKTEGAHQKPKDIAVKEEEDGMPILDMGKSYEQKLADLMVSVRRNLTELLLEVTNEEIAKISRETLNSSKLKASSAQVVRKSALSSITSKLGLAAYSSSGESDESDDSAESDKDGRRRIGTNTAADDSEEEIKTQLRMRRRAFAKTSEEIEERIAANAVREEQKLKYYKQKEQKQDNEIDKKREHYNDRDAASTSTSKTKSNSSTSASSGMGKNYSRDFGETTTESKLQQSNGKRSKERGIRRGGERTTRFSDNKDSKHMNAVTASYISQLTASSVASPAAALNPTSVAVQPLPMTAVVPNLPDVAKVRDMYPPPNASISSMLSAADAALEKAAAKCKSASTSSRSNVRDSRDRERNLRRRPERRHHASDNSDNSSSSSTTSSDTDSSSSSSSDSRDSKYSRTSSNSNSRHNNKHSSSSRYRHDERQYRQKRDRSDRDERHYRSHQRHTSTSKSTSSSSKSKYATERTTSSRHRTRSHSRDRSRSRSTYSSSSSKRHRR